MRFRLVSFKRFFDTRVLFGIACLSMPHAEGFMNDSCHLNVLQKKLESCGANPKTGYYRDGYCATGDEDRGVHVICSVVTEEFLQFSKKQGNDLITPMPEYGFKGLKPGDRWCLCALRWKEALDHDVAPPVILEATHAKALDYVSLIELRKKSLPISK